MAQQISWDDLGDLQVGRPHLGPYTTVLFWRLLLFHMKETLEKELGQESADRLIGEIGKRAGNLIYERFLAEARDLTSLVRELSHFLKASRVAVLRMEETDEERTHFVFTLLEGLDSSGTSATVEVKCRFNQALLAGVLSSFYACEVAVRELECWGKGRHVCRLEASADRPLRATAVSSERAPEEAAA